jgi:hypothetical protein
VAEKLHALLEKREGIGEEENGSTRNEWGREKKR